MIIKQGTEDGRLNPSSSSWPPVGGAAVDTSQSFLKVEATYYVNSSTYYLSRFYLRFNTSSIPPGALITGVKLWLKLMDKLDQNSFHIQTQVYRANGDWYPLDTGDWGCGNTLVGTKNYADLPAGDTWFSIDLNPSCINKGGITAFEIKCDHESGTAPTGFNYVQVCSADSSGNEPYLEISYILPGAILLMQL